MIVLQNTQATPYLCWAECDFFDCLLFSYAAGTGDCRVYADVDSIAPEVGTDVYVPSAADSCPSLTFAPTSAPSASPTSSPSLAPTDAPTSRPTAVGETYEPTPSPSSAPTQVCCVACNLNNLRKMSKLTSQMHHTRVKTPTGSPSASPSSSPSVSPSSAPTLSPTAVRLIL